MSIIADTLHRLQSAKEGLSPGPDPNSGLDDSSQEWQPDPVNNEPDELLPEAVHRVQDDSHAGGGEPNDSVSPILPPVRRPSRPRRRLWVVGLLLFLVLAGIAVGAFWWGATLLGDGTRIGAVVPMERTPLAIGGIPEDPELARSPSLLPLNPKAASARPGQEAKTPAVQVGKRDDPLPPSNPTMRSDVVAPGSAEKPRSQDDSPAPDTPGEKVNDEVALDPQPENTIGETGSLGTAEGTRPRGEAEHTQVGQSEETEEGVKLAGTPGEFAEDEEDDSDEIEGPVDSVEVLSSSEEGPPTEDVISAGAGTAAHGADEPPSSPSAVSEEPAAGAGSAEAQASELAVAEAFPVGGSPPSPTGGSTREAGSMSPLDLRPGSDSVSGDASPVPSMIGPSVLPSSGLPPSELVLKEAAPIIVEKPMTARARLQAAQSFIARRDYGEAANVLGPLFASPPEDWRPWFWLGTAELGLGNFEAAHSALRQGLVRNEDVPQLWVQWAVVAHQRGQDAQALEALREAERLASDLPEVQLNLALTLERLGSAESAVKHYRRYLSLSQHNPFLHPTREKVLERILHLEHGGNS